MPALTIRDIPPDLHNRLKESAARNRRSLNGEIIMRLQQSLRSGVGLGRTPEEIAELQERARRSRERLGFMTDEEIREAIREGRP